MKDQKAYAKAEVDLKLVSMPDEYSTASVSEQFEEHIRKQRGVNPQYKFRSGVTQLLLKLFWKECLLSIITCLM